MATTGEVNLTIADNSAAAISLPANDVQVVMGCCSGGSANVVVATRQPSTLKDTFGYGPLVQAAGMVLSAGGTVLAMKIPTTVAGSIAKKATKTVTNATVAAASVITTSTAHGLISGDVVTISGVGGTTTVNGTFPVTVLTSTTFSVPVAGVGVYTSGGTVTPLGSICSATAAGSAVIYFTGSAVYDEAYIQVDMVTGGTIGTDTIQFTVSLDAGRSRNLPRVTLDTSSATTYLIADLNVTINFGTGDVEAGDRARGYTIAPAWNTAGVTAALQALQNSPYASAGWGSMHLVGITSGADAASFQTTMEELAAAHLYDRLMCDTVDASPPVAWGGTGETDAAWSTSVVADFADVEARRVGVAAGYYNMRSPYPTAVSGQPLYRRCLTWAWAARVVQLPSPADHEGWVKLGSLSQITLDGVNDPNDGFVYHDEEATGGVFDSLYGGPGRITAARLRRGKPGWFITDPLSLAPVGSTFQLFPYCRVMDLASDIVQDVGQNYVNARVKLNRNGTIREQDAGNLESALYSGIDAGIGQMISGRTIAVDRTNNVQTTQTVIITGTIQGDGFVLQIDATLAYGTPEIGNTP